MRETFSSSRHRCADESRPILMMSRSYSLVAISSSPLKTLSVNGTATKPPNAVVVSTPAAPKWFLQLADGLHDLVFELFSNANQVRVLHFFPRLDVFAVGLGEIAFDGVVFEVKFGRLLVANAALV